MRSVQPSPLVLVVACICFVSACIETSSNPSGGATDDGQPETLDGESDLPAEVELRPVFESPRFITDAQGRVLFFHGMNINAGAKGAPGHIQPLDETDMQRVARDFGLNFVRYLIFWDGVEPKPGQINQTYLDAVELQLDMLHAAGLWVMLDMHQDVYAKRFCCDGAPEWAIRDDGLPFEMQSEWFANYLQPAVKRAFDNFWAYDRGEHAFLQDHYVAMWAAVAERFRDHPAVIGYDIMNEPHPGSDIDVIELLGNENPNSSHRAYDLEDLQPFYQRAIEAIREVDEENWIFVEPRYGAPGLGMPSYFGLFTDPRPGAARVAYAPHLYSLKTEATGVYDLEGDHTVANWERERSLELGKQPMPMLIGEWGLSHSTVNVERAILDVIELCDRMMAGWAYWDYSFGGWGFWEPDGSEGPNADLIVRPYPRRVAGEPLAYGYDRETRVFALRFLPQDDVTAPTVIGLPADRLYPDGWILEVSVDGAVDPTAIQEWDASLGVVRVTTGTDKAERTIEVRPAL